LFRCYKQVCYKFAFGGAYGTSASASAPETGWVGAGTVDVLRPPSLATSQALPTAFKGVLAQVQVLGWGLRLNDRIKVRRDCWRAPVA
jgi:hypothetical protein